MNYEDNVFEMINNLDSFVMSHDFVRKSFVSFSLLYAAVKPHSVKIQAMSVKLLDVDFEPN